MVVDVVRTEADYQRQLVNLLPPGPAWDAALQPEVHALLRDLAKEFSRVDERSYALMQEAFLATFHEALQDWETTLGLPDECLGGAGSVAERKTMVRVRLVEQGGQTPAFYVQLAARVGYPNASVQELRSPRFGRSRFGRDHFGTWDAQFMWILHAGGRLPGGSRFGLSVWGERFGSNPSDALVCVIRRAAPAHTLEFVEFS